MGLASWIVAPRCWAPWGIGCPGRLRLRQFKRLVGMPEGRPSLSNWIAFHWGLSAGLPPAASHPPHCYPTSTSFSSSVIASFDVHGPFSMQMIMLIARRFTCSKMTMIYPDGCSKSPQPGSRWISQIQAPPVNNQARWSGAVPDSS